MLMRHQELRREFRRAAASVRLRTGDPSAPWALVLARPNSHMMHRGGASPPAVRRIRGAAAIQRLPSLGQSFGSTGYKAQGGHEAP